jgi:hypothetical protein
MQENKNPNLSEEHPDPNLSTGASSAQSYKNGFIVRDTSPDRFIPIHINPEQLDGILNESSSFSAEPLNQSFKEKLQNHKMVVAASADLPFYKQLLHSG